MSEPVQEKWFSQWFSQTIHAYIYALLAYLGGYIYMKHILPNVGLKSHKMEATSSRHDHCCWLGLKASIQSLKKNGKFLNAQDRARKRNFNVNQGP